jgi:MFS family permease
MIDDSKKLGIDTAEDESEGNNKKSSISSEEKRSLVLILASVVLWFFAYNAVTSKYSVYAGTVLQKDYNLTLLIAQAAAIVSYLPIGIISSKIGRKKTIIAGVIMLST